LPKMAKNATASKLIHASRVIWKRPKNVTRLEKIFESLGLKAVAKKCDAMDYLKRLKELSKKLKLRCSWCRNDFAATKVEHYEIATITLRVYAVTLVKQSRLASCKNTWRREKCWRKINRNSCFISM
jgi:ferritin-like metal-binding protein YciE